MGPDFLENIGHAFLYPSSEKTDGLTALDRGKSKICDQENLWSLTLCEELLGETTHPDPSLTAGALSTTNTANQAAVAFQKMSIDRDGLFDFLKLPREIRDQIYNLSLITEYEIVMHPEDYEVTDIPAFGADDQPCVSLLQLNKQIYAESFPVFYGKNKFRLPTNPQHNAIYQKYSSEIHHVTVHIDYREVTDQEKRAIAIAEHMAPDTDFAPTRPDAARWRHIHKRHLDLMIAKWQPRRDFIDRQMNALITIQLDLSLYYCPGLCCRKAIIYSDLFHQFVNGSRNWIRNGGRIEVHGLATDLEENILSTPRWQSFAKLP